MFHEVSVEAQPAQESFSIGSKVTLHCRVSPTPVQPVTYQWRNTVPGATITQTSTSLPNATTVIQPSHPTYGHYYCNVHRYGAASTLGTGVIRIEVESELHTAHTELHTVRVVK